MDQYRTPANHDRHDNDQNHRRRHRFTQRVTIACSMLLLLVQWNGTLAYGSHYCLFNVTIACSMLRLLAECYDCLRNVTIACGMIRLRVDFFTFACGMVIVFTSECEAATYYASDCTSIPASKLNTHNPCINLSCAFLQSLCRRRPVQINFGMHAACHSYKTDRQSSMPFLKLI